MSNTGGNIEVVKDSAKIFESIKNNSRNSKGGSTTTTTTSTSALRKAATSIQVDLLASRNNNMERTHPHNRSLKSSTSQQLPKRLVHQPTSLNDEPLHSSTTNVIRQPPPPPPMTLGGYSAQTTHPPVPAPRKNSIPRSSTSNITHIVTSSSRVIKPPPPPPLTTTTASRSSSSRPPAMRHNHQDEINSEIIDIINNSGTSGPSSLPFGDYEEDELDDLEEYYISKNAATSAASSALPPAAPAAMMHRRGKQKSSRHHHKTKTKHHHVTTTHPASSTAAVAASPSYGNANVVVSTSVPIVLPANLFIISSSSSSNNDLASTPATAATLTTTAARTPSANSSSSTPPLVLPPAIHRIKSSAIMINNSNNNNNSNRVMIDAPSSQHRTAAPIDIPKQQQQQQQHQHQPQFKQQTSYLLNRPTMDVVSSGSNGLAASFSPPLAGGTASATAPQHSIIISESTSSLADGKLLDHVVFMTPVSGAAASNQTPLLSAAQPAPSSSSSSLLPNSRSSSNLVMLQRSNSNASSGASTTLKPQQASATPAESNAAAAAARRKRSSYEPQQQQLSKEEKDKRLQKLNLLNTIGTGTFGRVMMVQHATTREYFALKMMSVVELLRLKQVQHVKNEKSILESIDYHPFIVKLFWTHHNEQFLYMLMEYVPGGELFSLLRQRGRFDSKTAVFYAAEIVCAFEYLHGTLQVAYRDLKPENILLDAEGHLKLTDFGFAKKVLLPNKTYTLCGTPEYLAPEVIQNRGHDMCCDWWALGVLVHEMLSGSPPFYDEVQYKVYEKILQAKVEYPRHMDSTARDLIKKLLVLDPTKRLGSGNCGGGGAVTTATPLASRDSVTNLSRNNSSSLLVTSAANRLADEMLADSGVNVFLTTEEEIGGGAGGQLHHGTSTSSMLSYKNDSAQNLSLASISTLSIGGGGGGGGGGSATPAGKQSQQQHSSDKNQRAKVAAGIDEVRRHRWFISITDWSDVYERRMRPPFVPAVAHEGDTRNFERYETPDLSKFPSATEKQLEVFANF